jgi:septal ring factor EnvC (AmiA/AmiB activator)
MLRRLLIMLLTAGLLAGPPVAVSADPAGTRADLARARERIRNLEQQRRTAARERERLAAKLRQTEQAAAAVRAPLRDLARELAAVRAEQRRLAAETTDLRRELAADEARLAAQLRRAWVAGGSAPLRLILAPGEPAAAGQRLVWLGYVAREQEQLLARIDAALARLAEQEAVAETRAQELAALEAKQRARLAELDGARRERKLVLASLATAAAGRDAQLAKLREEAAALERLLRQLERAARASAPRKSEPDAGRALPPGRWPVDGKLLADFGQARAGGQLRWDGVLIAAPAGTDVRAARAGRVVYADWLPGLGLLLVLDHGRGYLSLYGHNQDLAKGVGADVASGETIARVGDTGGQGRSALYFEVRKNGRPQNPRQWVK